MSAALLLSIAFPGLVALGLLHPATRQGVARMLPFVPWPALALALFGLEVEAHYPRLLLGAVLGLDETARVFMLFTAAVWSAVGFHLRDASLDPARERDRRFLLCYLLAMAGNLGVIVAFDPPSFYLCFAVLSLSAWGLIVTDTSSDSRRAGRVYLILALLGEVLILIGFIALSAGQYGLALALLLYVGLGIKHGILPLHLWLPLAHGISPAPASALLSGVLVKAGIIGWLRFLPETGALDSSGVTVIAFGLAAAILGALVGVLQVKPKMLLAYSTISQMGILTVGFGMALTSVELWVAIVPALTLFACHHALVKAALFLGVGVERSRRGGGLVLPLFGLLGLSLAAAPYTGGALVKLWLSQFTAALTPGTAWMLDTLLPLTSLTTTVLMFRFMWLAWAPSTDRPGVGRARATPYPFLVLSGLALVGPWLLFWASEPAAGDVIGGWYAFWKTLWPVALGLLLALAAARFGRQMPWVLPPGDVIVPLEKGVLALWRRLPQTAPTLPRPAFRYIPPWRQWEAWLRRFPVIGVTFMACLLIFAAVGGVLVGG